MVHVWSINEDFVAFHKTAATKGLTWTVRVEIVCTTGDFSLLVSFFEDLGKLLLESDENSLCLC